MSKFTLNQIAQSQEEMKKNSFNTDLFSGDREPIEWDKSAYSEIHLVTTDHVHDRGEHDNLKETVICVGHEDDFYLISAITTSFNGETQHKYTSQELTLQGFNYFGKEIEADFTEVYNNYLGRKGYEITVDDIKTLGELNTEYNSTTLRFKDEEENMHYITVNGRDQLSKITVKLASREVKTKSSMQSAFN